MQLTVDEMGGEGKGELIEEVGLRDEGNPLIFLSAITAGGALVKTPSDSPPSPSSSLSPPLPLQTKRGKKS